MCLTQKPDLPKAPLPAPPPLSDTATEIKPSGASKKRKKKAASGTSSLRIPLDRFLNTPS